MRGGEREHAGAQRRIVERREPVEEGHQPDRDEGREQDLTAVRAAPAQATSARAPRQEGVHELERAKAQDAADREALARSASQARTTG